MSELWYPDRDCAAGWHITERHNEAAIDREGFKAPVCLTIGWPEWGSFLHEMAEGEELVVYKIFLERRTLYPDDDGPPNFRLNEPIPPRDEHGARNFVKVAYSPAEDNFRPIPGRLGQNPPHGLQ